MDKVLAETDWGCHPCRAYVRKNIFLYSSVSLRGIRGDWIVTRLLTWPQRKLPKPADLKSFFVSFFLYFCSNGGFDATEQILALFQSLYILMLVVHHAPAQELTCSSLNMHPQHAYQQPSPPPALLHIICLIYCMPLTNCQRPIPLLQMSIDQSTSMAVEKVYSLTHTLIFLLPLVSQKLTEKGEFQKRREKKSIDLEVKRSKVQTAWRI